MAKDNIPTYQITIDPAYAENGEDLGIEQIAFTATPAIKVKGMAFSAQAKPLFFSDELKYRITAPALIPMEIYRFDEDSKEEYNVKFTEQEIEKIHGKFMQQMVNRDLFNLEHDQSKTVPAYVLEAWIVDNPKEDKAYSSFGIEVPEGTLMVTAQVTDKEYYAELVSQEQIGFSIEGYLGMKLKEQKQSQNNTQMNELMLPDGEHIINEKIYVVKDGKVVEVKDVEKVEASEEVALEETVIEEEVTAEVPAEEQTMAVDPVADAEAILAIVKPAMDEQMNALLAMIADLKNQLEEALSVEVEEEVMSEGVTLSAHQRFSSVNKYGLDKLKFCLLEECQSEDLESREQYYITNSKNLFNETIDVKACNRGKKLSEETKQKISNNKERSEKISKALKGRKITWKTNNKQ